MVPTRAIEKTSVSSKQAKSQSSLPQRERESFSLSHGYIEKETSLSQYRSVLPSERERKKPLSLLLALRGCWRSLRKRERSLSLPKNRTSRFSLPLSLSFPCPLSATESPSRLSLHFRGSVLSPARQKERNYFSLSTRDRALSLFPQGALSLAYGEKEASLSLSFADRETEVSQKESALFFWRQNHHLPLRWRQLCKKTNVFEAPALEKPIFMQENQGV